MKLIIAGSREITNHQIVSEAYFDCCPFIATEIVSGGARGVDSIGEAIGVFLNLPIKVFTANWTEHGKSAGYKRNIEMAEYADALLAIWDGNSKGTKHMIDIMNKKGKPVYVYRTDENK